MSSYIFILRLEGDRYFVGRSRNVKERIRAHFEGRGSEWTRLYRPISVVRIFKSKYIEERDMWTKRLMNQYSIDQVRGGSYVRIDLTAEQREFIQKELRGAKEQCFGCGSNQHFIRDCPQKYNQYSRVPIGKHQRQRSSWFHPSQSMNPFGEITRRRSELEAQYANAVLDQDESEYEPLKFQRFFLIDQDNFEDYWDQLYIESDEQEGVQQPRQQDQSESIYRHQPERQQNSQERFSSYMSDFIESSSSLGSFINDEQEVVDSYESSEYGLSNLHYQQQGIIAHQQNESFVIELAADKAEPKQADVFQEEIISKYLIGTLRGQAPEEVHCGSQDLRSYPKRKRREDQQSESEEIHCFRKRRKRSQQSEPREKSQPEQLQRLRFTRNYEQQSHFGLSKMKKIKAFLAPAGEEAPAPRCLRKLRKI